MPVLIAGDPEPDPPAPQAIVLQDVSSVPVPTYGKDARTSRIQITCYAPTKLEALGIEARALTALRGVGLRWIASRPAADQDYIGQISEFRR